MMDFMCYSEEFNGPVCKMQCLSCRWKRGDPKPDPYPTDYRKLLLAYARAVYFASMRTYDENIPEKALTRDERYALNTVLNEVTAKPTRATKDG